MSSTDATPNILYQDDSLLIINKPAGLRSLPDGYDPSLPHLAQLLEPEFGPLLMVHRLDKETSGIILLARTTEAHRILNIQFQKREIHKIYHALALGVPPWQEQTATLPLLKDGDRHHRTTINFAKGKKAETEFTVLEVFREITYIEARPRSGYTHQIRAHLAYLGYPIAFDHLYAPFAKNVSFEPEAFLEPTIDRMALHAFSITFTHPTSGQSVTFEAPEPFDFSSALQHLRQQKQQA